MGLDSEPAGSSLHRMTNGLLIPRIGEGKDAGAGTAQSDTKRACIQGRLEDLHHSRQQESSIRLVYAISHDQDQMVKLACG